MKSHAHAAKRSAYLVQTVYGGMNLDGKLLKWRLAAGWTALVIKVLSP